MLSTRPTIEIAQLLDNYHALPSTFSDVGNNLSLTLPVTVAMFERSFSKLKLIKNYTKYHVRKEAERPGNVVNSKYSRKLDTSKVIDICVHA